MTSPTATETAADLTYRRARDESASPAIRVAFAAAHRIVVLEDLADTAPLALDHDKARTEVSRIAADAVTTVQLLDGLSTPEATGIVREAIGQGRARTAELKRNAARGARRADLSARAQRLGRRLCQRCEGEGRWSGNGGTCYGCGGDGLDPHYFVDEG